ncbi:hypothetical protein C8J56DRAFT_1058424 [Mycena floridula]|nr:hypothetical protein C8J56DRAFT_1058424 [Mycena floridula]
MCLFSTLFLAHELFRNQSRLRREMKAKYHDKKTASTSSSSTKPALSMDPTDGLPMNLLEMSPAEQIYSIQQAELRRLRLEALSCEREYQRLSHGSTARDLLPSMIYTALTKSDKMAGYSHLTSHLPPLQALLDRLRPIILELYRGMVTAEHERCEILEVKLYGLMNHIQDAATYCYRGLDALQKAQGQGKLSYQRDK